MSLPTGAYNLHREGSFTVLHLPDGRYHATVRFADSSMVRIGNGRTPAQAISNALNVN